MFFKKRDVEPLPIAVIDVETTGLHWTGHDRICEIAVVRLSPDGEVLDTYETLVNPGRDLGPTHIHGIDAAECLAAPAFEAVAGDILDLLQGVGCLAGHNVTFDARFLAAEYKRLGVSLNRHLKTLCTYRLTSLSLANASTQFEIESQGAAHSALADALATAELVRCLANEAIVDLHEFVTPLELPRVDMRHTPTVNRRAAQAVVQVRSGFLEELADRVAYGFDASDEVTLNYLSLLRKILEDRIFDEGERAMLRAFVQESAMPVDQVRQLHERYLEAIAIEAWADKIITEHELKDLKRVARLLDLDASAVDTALEKAKSEAVSVTPAETVGAGLAGRTVCFTGAILSTIGDEVITRALAKDLAEAAGLVIKSSVSRKLDMLVVADPDTNSGKARKARECGTRIIAERDFFPMIGVTLS